MKHFFFFFLYMCKTGSLIPSLCLTLAEHVWQTVLPSSLHLKPQDKSILQLAAARLGAVLWFVRKTKITSAPPNVHFITKHIL